MIARLMGYDHPPYSGNYPTVGGLPDADWSKNKLPDDLAAAQFQGMCSWIDEMDFRQMEWRDNAAR